MKKNSASIYGVFTFFFVVMIPIIFSFVEPMASSRKGVSPLFWPLVIVGAGILSSLAAWVLEAKEGGVFFGKEIIESI